MYGSFIYRLQKMTKSAKSNSTDATEANNLTANEFDWPQGLLNSAGFLLNRLGRRLHERLNLALAPLQLTTQELGLLRIINEHGPLTQQSLGKKNLTDRTTVVHLLDTLEERQLVVRTRNQTDRRSHLLYLTPRGKKTLARAIKITEREQVDFLQPLTGDEWQSVRSSLIKLLLHYEQT
jgi:DNA-binding MarR family transcriptional regulator